MSLLYNVLFATRCRSNHHRLALDALRWLEGPDAERWRSLFLHHHEAYLEGAKAPDERFKDFKNHVLHVQDNYWGGAITSAEEWKKRTLRALQAKDWKLAIYSAGVLSHYVVDPIQPFHTGQTEAENVIHRAVEQSFSKAYEDLQELLEELGGYPKIALADGPDWLAQAIREGAEAANAHYDTIITHYDFAKGAKKPLDGLDETIELAIAPLIGRAAVTVARVLDRVVAEAAVSPPNVSTSLDAVFATLAVPIRAVANKLASDKERALVLAMYQEFQQTGKVRKTLPEDDRQVRALYAIEVAKAPLSDLDAQWPAEIGLAHGVPPEQAGLAAPAEKPAAPAPQAIRQPQPAPPPRPAPESPAPETAPFGLAALAAQAAASPAFSPAAAEESAASGGGPVSLCEDDPIVDAPSIGLKTAARFEAVGLRTVGDLLAVTPEEAARSIKASHITPPVIRDWQAQAMLACVIPGLRAVDAAALVACGVRDTETLAGKDASGLAQALAAYFKSAEGKQFARHAKPAAPETVAQWVAAARAGEAKAA